MTEAMGPAIPKPLGTFHTSAAESWNEPGTQSRRALTRTKLKAARFRTCLTVTRGVWCATRYMKATMPNRPGWLARFN